MNKIYVLEDDPGILEIVELILLDANYEVECYSNCTEFMAGVENGVPDLFLLDVRLPDGNGMEMCKRLSQNEATKHIPILMMSAHEKPGNVWDIACAKGFIAKPFDIAHLLRLVGNQLN